MSSTITTTGRLRGFGILGIVALAIAALGGGVVAQSASPTTPAEGTPAASPGTPATPGAVTRLPGCRSRIGRSEWAQRGPQSRLGPRARRGDRTPPWLGQPRRQAPGWFGQRGDRMGARGRLHGADMPWRLRQMGARRALVRWATVSAVEGGSLTLTTRDGWTRVVDAASVTIVRGGSPVGIAAVPAGTRVRVVERRGDDGSWQVARLVVALAHARGTVVSVSADGFRLATAGDHEVTVRTSDDTTWLTGCQQGGDLASLEVGSLALVRGVAAEDGSIDATTVSVAAPRQGMRRQRVRQAPPPVVSPAPLASPALGAPSA